MSASKSDGESSASEVTRSTAGEGALPPRSGASDGATAGSECPTREDAIQAGPARKVAGQDDAVREDGVYFFPEETVTASEVRALIDSGSRDDQARVVSHLLTYAEYAEIWTWVDRDLVRELFDDLQMPDRLRTAWARNLGLVAKSS